MAKKTQPLSPEALRGFVEELQRTNKFNANKANVQNRLAEIRENGLNNGPGVPGQNGGSGWDNALHVGGRALDIIGMFGYGANRAISDALKTTDQAKDDPAGATLAMLNTLFGPGRAVSVVKGAADAVAGNQQDLVHGHEIIEDAADRYGKASDRNYKDVQDNVNPVAKGVGGFALDVVNDPTTMLPAGPIAKAAGGGLKASVNAARATPGGDLAKTAAFFNPITAAKGAGEGLKEWGTGAKATIKGLAARPVAQEAEAALSTGARVSANLPKRAEAEVPTTAARGTTKAEVPVNPAAVAAQSAPAPQQRALTDQEGWDLQMQREDAARAVGAERATTGVAEGTRAAEAAAQAATTAATNARTAGRSAEDAAQREAAKPVEQATEAIYKDTEKSIRTQMAEQLDPAIARAAAAGPSSEGVLADLRALTYTRNAYPAKIQRQAEKITPAPPKSDKEARAAWKQEVTDLLGEDAAKTLAKIEDPIALGVEARKIARGRVTETMEGRTPKDAFDKLKSSRNEFDPAKVRELANQLGLKDIPEVDANWKDFSDYLRRTDPYKAYDEVRRAEHANRTMLSGTTIPGKDIAEPIAKETDPLAARVKASVEADDLLPPEVAARIDDMIANIFPADFGKNYPFTVKNPRTGETFHGNKKAFGDDFNGINKYVFNQNHQLTLWKQIVTDASKGFTGVKNVATRQDAIYDRVVESLRYADLRLKSLGIVPVNGAFAKEKYLMKTKGDHAFLSFYDVISALPPEEAKALLFSGKNLNVPITLVADLAREALRVAGTESSTVDLATHLLHTAQKRLRREAASDKLRAVQKRVTDNHTLLRGMVGALATPDVIQRLAKANVDNLAFGLAVNGEKAARATRPLIKTLREFALDPNVTAGHQIDAVLAARDALRTMVRSTEIEGSPAEGIAETMLDKGLAQTTSSGVVKQARAALGQERAVVDAAGQPVKPEVKQKKKAAAEAATAEANAPGKEPKAPKKPPATEASKKAEVKTRAASNTARAAEHAQVVKDAEKMVRELVEKSDAVVDDPVYDLDAAFAAFSADLPGWLRTAFKGAEKMDGWFGKQQVKPFAISAEMNSQNMMMRYTKALNAAGKDTPREHILAAIGIFQRMDGNGGLEVALTDAAPEIADAARRLWPTFSVVFDHSEHGLLQRIGMNGSYANDFLKRQGVPDQYLLPGDQTWEAGQAWKNWDLSKAEDPLTLLDNYHRALVRAQIVPDTAAQFSAHFGNKSTVHGSPLSPAEARAAGWVKADTESGRFGSLFQFLDPDQYYPKEMLTQLSLMDRYFAASRSLDSNSFFDRTFRYIDPITNSVKATITLWRPGHHMTNITGEALMNSLDGVVNPLDYMTAWRVLVGSGRADRKGMDALQQYLEAAAPQGVQVKQATGVPVNFKGRGLTSIDERQFHQLLEQSGIIVPTHQAEDLLQDTIEGAGRTSKDGALANAGRNKVIDALRKVNKTVAPGWLSTFSANRDNYFRIAHAAKILRTQQFDNLSQAAEVLTERINKFHPNMLTLGATEQKYVRRLIYFYTWQRQALTRVLTSMIDTPGRVMIAPKALYNAGVAGGVEGQSWGEPVPDEGGIPDYLRGNIGQFMSLDPITGEPGVNPDYLWGTTVNAPQLDILSTVFGSIAVDPEASPWEQAGETAWQFTSKNVLQNLAPIYKIPIELGTHAKVGTGVPIQEGDEGKYLIEQTGLRAPLVVSGMLNDPNDSPAIQQQKQETGLWNYLTGLRRTLYNGPEQYDIWYRQQQEKAREAAGQ